MDDLLAYQELVNQKAEENSTDLLPNAGELHAAIVFSKMFEKTEHCINMVVGSLDGKVCDQDNYLEKLSKCLERRVEFKVIFLDDPNGSKAFHLIKYKKDNGYPITLRLAPEKVKNTFVIKNKVIHFSTFDKNKYRFEKDSKNYLAWFCFNDEKTTNSFQSMFDKAFKYCVDL